jgi:hypothetical protein
MFIRIFLLIEPIFLTKIQRVFLIAQNMIKIMNIDIDILLNVLFSIESIQNYQT